MLKGHEKFRIPDDNKEKDFFVEVNWKPKDEKTNECKVLKITFPNGEEAMVKREYLNAMLFAIGKEDDQRKMIPQTIKRVKWYETVVSVKAKKAIAKDEEIVFPIKISLPSMEEEAIAEIKENIKENRSFYQ